jgi:tetratricopeptide (TPR) repeat protein
MSTNFYVVLVAGRKPLGVNIAVSGGRSFRRVSWLPIVPDVPAQRGHDETKMQADKSKAKPTPAELAGIAGRLKADRKWEDLAALAAELPAGWGREWVPAADEAAFALGQLGRFDEARDLFLRCYEIESNHRFASALAYVHYAALLRHKIRKPRLAEPEPYRKAFERDFVYALLAEIALAQNRTDDAAAWIELHVLPHHRKPYVWRILGDSALRRGQPRRAQKLYKSALLKDRAGRHKTLLRMGRIHELAGEVAEARRAYEQAAEFKRRRYLSEDAEALEALAELCERAGDREGARNAYVRMARLPGLGERAEQALARLTG